MKIALEPGRTPPIKKTPGAARRKRTQHKNPNMYFFKTKVILFVTHLPNAPPLTDGYLKVGLENKPVVISGTKYPLEPKLHQQ